MKTFVKMAALSAVLFISACAVKPSNPQQAVFEVETAYKDALSVAAAYDSLPSCTAGTTVVCSSTAVAKQLKSAKDVAQIAVDNAEKAVRDPNFATGSMGEVIVAAQAAVAALTAITTLQAVQTAVKGAKK
jgi:hypothetical protein